MEEKKTNIAGSAVFWKNLKLDSEQERTFILATAIVRPGLIFSSVLGETVLVGSMVNANTSLQRVKEKGCFAFSKKEKPLRQSNVGEEIKF